jgi:ubiquinone biosynthesis protein UbiJ
VQRLSRLQGKAITIEILPFHWLFQCLFTETGVCIYKEEMIPSETTIRGTPLQFLGVLKNKQHRQAAFADELTMDGSAEFGQQVMQLFDELAIDWEEQASRLLGDVPAYHASRLLGKLSRWVTQVDQSLSDDINEYAHEEAKWVPPNEALTIFLKDIDALSMDVDRLDAKVKQLRAAIMKDEVTS